MTGTLRCRECGKHVSRTHHKQSYCGTECRNVSQRRSIQIRGKHYLRGHEFDALLWMCILVQDPVLEEEVATLREFANRQALYRGFKDWKHAYDDLEYRSKNSTKEDLQ